MKFKKRKKYNFQPFFLCCNNDKNNDNLDDCVDRTQILQQLSRSDFEENEKEEVLGDHKRFYDIITLPSFRCLPTPWMVAPMSS